MSPPTSALGGLVHGTPSTDAVGETQAAKGIGPAAHAAPHDIRVASTASTAMRLDRSGTTVPPIPLDDDRGKVPPHTTQRKPRGPSTNISSDNRQMRRSLEAWVMRRFRSSPT